MRSRTSTPERRSLAADARAVLTYAEALNEALREEMRRDPTVFVHGRGRRALGPGGGVFGVTKGLVDEFGPERVRDTPISEEAIVGLARRAPRCPGMRPVAEIMYSDFMALAMDPIVNQAAKMRYMFGGKISVPMVIRTNSGAPGNGGPALAVARGLVRPRPRPQGRHAVDARTTRRACSRRRHPRRQPGDLPRAQAALLHEGRGPDGRARAPVRAAAIVREGRDVTVVANQTHGAARRSRPQTSSRPRASSSR